MAEHARWAVRAGEDAPGTRPPRNVGGRTLGLLAVVVTLAACTSGRAAEPGPTTLTPTGPTATGPATPTTVATPAPPPPPAPAPAPTTAPLPPPRTLDLLSSGQWGSIVSDPTETARGRAGYVDATTVSAWARAGPGTDAEAIAYSYFSYEHDSAELFAGMPERVQAVTVDVAVSIAAAGELTAGFDRTTTGYVKFEARVDDNSRSELPVNQRITADDPNPFFVGFDSVVQIVLTVTREDVSSGEPLSVVVGVGCEAESGSHPSGVISQGGTCDFETAGYLTVRSLTATVTPVA